VFGWHYDSYVTKHYQFEGWPMHEYVVHHVPRGSRIWYIHSSVQFPSFYWQDYDVFTEKQPCDYVLLVKQDMKQLSDGSWLNTYFNVQLPALSGKVWETDKAILFRAL